jgi:ADP-ribose pyrophosphatase
VRDDERIDGKLATIGQGSFLRLVREGGRWEWVERIGCRDAVAVVATTAHDELILIEEERPPVGGAVISLPAGLIGDEQGRLDESPQLAGLRELDEETGYFGESAELLHSGPVSPGLTNERIVFVRVHHAKRRHAGGGVDGEKILVHVVGRAKIGAFLRERLQAGCEIDCKVYAGLFWLNMNPAELAGP